MIKKILWSTIIVAVLLIFNISNVIAEPVLPVKVTVLGAGEPEVLLDHVKSVLESELTQISDVQVVEEEYLIEMQIIVQQPELASGEDANLIILSTVVAMPGEEGAKYFVYHHVNSGDTRELQDICQDIVEGVNDNIFIQWRQALPEQNG